MGEITNTTLFAMFFVCFLQILFLFNIEYVFGLLPALTISAILVYMKTMLNIDLSF